MDIVEQLEDKGNTGKTCKISRVLCSNTDQYEKAIDCYRKAIKIAEELGDKEKVGRTYKNMGNAAYMNTDQYKGIDCYRKAFELAEELGDKEEVGRAYTTNGSIYNNTRQFDKAFECFRKALEIAEKLDDKALLGITYRNMGNAYNNTDQYDKAIDCYRKALEISEELGDKEEVGRTYSGMGDAYNNSSQYDKAIECYRKALEIAEIMGDKKEVERIYSNMGAIYKSVTAVAGGEAGPIGLQKESQEFEKHENVESGLIKDANIEEGSQSASGDPAGLGESENERVAFVEPSPNRSGFCEENSKNTVEEKNQSETETEALGGPAGGLGESKNEVNCIREAKSQYTNKTAEESTVSRTTVSAGSAMNSTCEKVIAKVIFDYDAGGDDELSLKKGELVEVLDQKDDGWWKGLLKCGKVGLFSTNFVEFDREEGSISIPKSQPTSVPITPAKEEPVLSGDEDDDDDSHYHYGEDIDSPVNQEPVSTSSEDYTSEEDETWFEATLMDEVVMDLNKNTKDKLKGLTWKSGYGLGWPNEKFDDYHLIVYLKCGEDRDDRFFCEELVKLFGNEAIKEFVDFRRPTEEVKVRFLADAPDAPVKCPAEPGTGIYMQTEKPIDPLTTLETREAIHGKNPVISRKGTLTAICHDIKSKPKTSYAMTCFHVGYNGEYDVNFNVGVDGEAFKRKFDVLKMEAETPSTQQRQTEYFYEDSPGHHLPLGQYRECLVNENNDVLLISLKPDVNVECAIENFSGTVGLKRKRKKTKVVKIGPGEIKEGTIRERLTELDNIPFEDFYGIRSTNPEKSFLEAGDSGSLVCIKGTKKKLSPFAYGVAEIDLTEEELQEFKLNRKSHADPRLTLCLDFKNSLKDLNEKMRPSVRLVPCFKDCDSAGLSECENERVGSVGPSPNLRSGFCDENYNNIVEEKIQSGTEALGGPAGGHGESKDKEIAFVKPNSNTNKIEEGSQSGSQSTSNDPAGLGETENESVASMEPSAINRSGFCEENSKNTVEEKVESRPEALGGPAGGLDQSKDEGIVFVKPSPNTSGFCDENYNNTVEEKIQSGTEALGGPAGGHGESKDEGIVFVKPSPNTSGFCEENSNNTVEEKIKSGTEALGGPAGDLGESKDEGIAFVKPSPNTNEIEEGSQSASGDPAGLGESENERVASVEPSPNRGGLCEENSKKDQVR